MSGPITQNTVENAIRQYSSDHPDHQYCVHCNEGLSRGKGCLHYCDSYSRTNRKLKWNHIKGCYTNRFNALRVGNDARKSGRVHGRTMFHMECAVREIQKILPDLHGFEGLLPVSHDLLMESNNRNRNDILASYGVDDLDELKEAVKEKQQEYIGLLLSVHEFTVAGSYNFTCGRVSCVKNLYLDPALQNAWRLQYAQSNCWIMFMKFLHGVIDFKKIERDNSQEMTAEYLPCASDGLCRISTFFNVLNYLPETIQTINLPIFVWTAQTPVLFSDLQTTYEEKQMEFDVFKASTKMYFLDFANERGRQRGVRLKNKRYTSPVAYETRRLQVPKYLMKDKMFTKNCQTFSKERVFFRSYASFILANLFDMGEVENCYFDNIDESTRKQIFVVFFGLFGFPDEGNLSMNDFCLRLRDGVYDLCKRGDSNDSSGVIEELYASNLVQQLMRCALGIENAVMDKQWWNYKDQDRTKLSTFPDEYKSEEDGIARPYIIQSSVDALMYKYFLPFLISSASPRHSEVVGIELIVFSDDSESPSLRLTLSSTSQIPWYSHQKVLRDMMDSTSRREYLRKLVKGKHHANNSQGVDESFTALIFCFNLTRYEMGRFETGRRHEHIQYGHFEGLVLTNVTSSLSRESILQRISEIESFDKRLFASPYHVLEARRNTSGDLDEGHGRAKIKIMKDCKDSTKASWSSGQYFVTIARPLGGLIVRQHLLSSSLVLAPSRTPNVINLDQNTETMVVVLLLANILDTLSLESKEKLSTWLQQESITSDNRQNRRAFVAIQNNSTKDLRKDLLHVAKYASQRLQEGEIKKCKLKHIIIATVSHSTGKSVRRKLSIWTQSHKEILQEIPTYVGIDGLKIDAFFGLIISEFLSYLNWLPRLKSVSMIFHSCALLLSPGDYRKVRIEFEMLLKTVFSSPMDRSCLVSFGYRSFDMDKWLISSEDIDVFRCNAVSMYVDSGGDRSFLRNFQTPLVVYDSKRLRWESYCDMDDQCFADYISHLNKMVCVTHGPAQAKYGKEFQEFFNSCLGLKTKFMLSEKLISPTVAIPLAFRELREWNTRKSNEIEDQGNNDSSCKSNLCQLVSFSHSAHFIHRVFELARDCRRRYHKRTRTRKRKRRKLENRKNNKN